MRHYYNFSRATNFLQSRTDYHNTFHGHTLHVSHQPLLPGKPFTQRETVTGRDFQSCMLSAEMSTMAAVPSLPTQRGPHQSLHQPGLAGDLPSLPALHSGHCLGKRLKNKHTKPRSSRARVPQLSATALNVRSCSQQSAAALFALSANRRFPHARQPPPHTHSPTRHGGTVAN